MAYRSAVLGPATMRRIPRPIECPAVRLAHGLPDSRRIVAVSDDEPDQVRGSPGSHGESTLTRRSPSSAKTVPRVNRNGAISPRVREFWPETGWTQRRRGSSPLSAG